MTITDRERVAAQAAATYQSIREVVDAGESAFVAARLADYDDQVLFEATRARVADARRDADIAALRHKLIGA